MSQSQPLVSIWVITYNHEKFIRQCLESVIAQKTNFAYEIIIGEDCSTDNTKQVIQEFEKKFPNIIKPIYQPVNVGAYANAYQYCYPKLTGKYVACLEADDYWTDEYKLQKQVDALENDKSAVACFTQVNVLLDQENRFEAHWSAARPVKSRYRLTDILHTFNIVTCSLLFRNIYQPLPYHPQDFPTGDVSLSAFLLLQGDAIFINEVTAVYRVHEGGIFSPHSLAQKNMVFVKIFEQLLKEPLFDKHQPLLKKLLSDRAYQAYCFEIKKTAPDAVLANSYVSLSIRHIGASNLYFPLKAFLRKCLYQITGKGFGRKLDQ